MGCMFSQLAAKFAFFPPSPPTYQIKKRDNGKLAVVPSSSSVPLPLADDTSLDVLLVDTKRGNKIVTFYLKNPYARLTVLYSHGNAADLGQLYDLFVQLKVNLRVNLMGLVFFFFIYLFLFLKKLSESFFFLEHDSLHFTLFGTWFITFYSIFKVHIFMACFLSLWA